MRKIVEIVAAVCGTVVLCFVVSMFIPELRSFFLLLFQSGWQIIKLFFLKDIIKTVVLYIIIASVVVSLGYGISRKTKNNIWIAASIILDTIYLIVTFITIR